MTHFKISVVQIANILFSKVNITYVTSNKTESKQQSFVIFFNFFPKVNTFYPCQKLTPALPYISFCTNGFNLKKKNSNQCYTKVTPLERMTSTRNQIIRYKEKKFVVQCELNASIHIKSAKILYQNHIHIQKSAFEHLSFQSSNSKKVRIIMKRHQSRSKLYHVKKCENHLGN